MSAVFLTGLFFLLLLSIPYISRAIRGPTVFDRVIGINGMGTKVPVFLILVGLVYGRAEMFVDMALALFLLNLFVTLLLAKYVKEKGGL